MIASKSAEFRKIRRIAKDEVQRLMRAGRRARIAAKRSWLES